MIKKICNVLSTVVLAVLMVLAAVILVPMIGGYKELVVLSGSMEPTISVGSLVYVKQVDPSQLKVGDVCTYYLENGETFVTHRVISTNPEAKTLVTQGDANQAPDGDIDFEQVYGKVGFHLPYIGYMVTNVKTPVGIMSICGVLMLVIILNFVPAIIDAGEEEKRKSKAALPKEGVKP